MDKVRCIICRKIIKTPQFMVHMRTDGRLFALGLDPKMDEREDQGWFDIGPDCLRLVTATGKDGYRL